ncbi:hypothetical protein [Brevibacillus laterosporus]|nr:hypothetical protein [Brevibacillus laterosporus]MBM7108488.1 hypothetical protein [Brevibacillus laterosporus]
MRHNTTQVIFLSKENNILTELQNDVVRLLVMPSLRKVVAYHE